MPTPERSCFNFDGDKCKSVRLAHGWTLTDIGNAIGTSPVAVSRAERGINRPLLTTARDIAFAMRTPESELSIDGQDFHGPISSVCAWPSAASDLDDYIARLVAEAPPLTAAQRRALSALLG